MGFFYLIERRGKLSKSLAFSRAVVRNPPIFLIDNHYTIVFSPYEKQKSKHGVEFSES